jgi:hypothetical protein
MKVSDEWLTANATRNGGYTKRQLALLNVHWPPVSGWKAQVVGLDIDAATTAEFEQIAQHSRAAR